MATTNLHLAKDLNGKALELRDIKRGIKANFPSGAGGSITCVCTECKDTHATFESTNKDWPSTWTIRVDVKDLSLNDLINLGEALRAYDSWDKTCTSEQKALVSRASNLGYATVRSSTQACWTERGIEKKAELEAVLSNVADDDELTDQLLNKIIPVEDAYELMDVIGDMKKEEKLEAIKQLISSDSIAYNNDPLTMPA